MGGEREHVQFQASGARGGGFPAKAMGLHGVLWAVLVNLAAAVAGGGLVCREKMARGKVLRVIARALVHECYHHRHGVRYPNPKPQTPNPKP